MKKKAIVILSVLIVFIILGGIIVQLALKKNTEDPAESGEETASSENISSAVQGAEEMLSESDDSGEEKKDQESEASGRESEEKDQKPEKSNNEDSSDADTPSGGSGGSHGGSGSSGGQNSPDNSSADAANDSAQQDAPEQAPQTQTAEESTPAIPTISFPYAIGGTDLVIQQVSAYDGYFIEDGSDKEVSGIAAIVVKNNGGDLKFAGIGISQGSRSLGFSASQIPAGATVIIQEQNGAAYNSDPYYSATATTTPTDSFEMSEELVTVADNGENGISVTNVSGEKLSEVTVYFKNYLPDEDVYVGGITYSIKLTDLEPDTVTDVSASHYGTGYSVIVEVVAKE